MSSLFPVARKAAPISVPKNQYSAQISSATTTAPITSTTVDCRSPVASVSQVKIESTFNRGILLFCPIILRLMDQREYWVRIPARIAGISNTVCRNPVTAPAANPAKVEISSARIGLTPYCAISTAQVQPPKAKLPSTVRSAISIIRKVM